MKKSWIAVLVTAFAATAGAQVSFGGSYSQNFDTLLNTGTNNPWTDNSTLAGWYMRLVGDPTTELTDQYTAGTGSSTTGAVYSFGSAGSGERALGSVGSGTVEHAAYGVRLTNNTGSSISSLNLAFFAEQWRDGGNAASVAHRTLFSYSLNSTGIGADTQPTSGVAGYVADTNFTTVSSFDLVSPVFGPTAAALDGNLAANRVSVSGALTLSSAWANGSDLWIRWVDINDVGNDMGLAVDDLSISSAPVPEPASIAALTVGALALIRRRRARR